MITPNNWNFSIDGYNGTYDQERGSLSIHVQPLGDCSANIRASYSDEHPVYPEFTSVSLETLESIAKRLREVFPQTSQIEIDLGDEFSDPSVNVDWSEKQFEWSESTLSNVVHTRILEVLDKMEIK